MWPKLFLTPKRDHVKTRKMRLYDYMDSMNGVNKTN